MQGSGMVPWISRANAWVGYTFPLECGLIVGLYSGDLFEFDGSLCETTVDQVDGKACDPTGENITWLFRTCMDDCEGRAKPSQTHSVPA